MKKSLAAARWAALAHGRVPRRACAFIGEKVEVEVEVEEKEALALALALALASASASASASADLSLDSRHPGFH